MFAFVLCLFVLLAGASLAQPAERATGEAPPSIEQPLCSSVRGAVNSPQLEEATALLKEEAATAPPYAGPQVALQEREKLSPAERLRLIEEREIFESSLVHWLFFEDLAPRQRAIVRGVLVRCGTLGTRPSLAASVFGQWNASQRATFVGITHALLNTHLIDSRDGTDFGSALELIQDLIDIQGENNALSSDQQFQLIVRLTSDARGNLEHAEHFLKGENHIFHKDYPVSFRQFRRIGLHGQEAGLHFCLTRDGHFAQIHIDYRFGLLHLAPANSDVRAKGNHQRHADRWPQFAFAIRPMQMKRVVLQ
jgi:hypothetical protein